MMIALVYFIIGIIYMAIITPKLESEYLGVILSKKEYIFVFVIVVLAWPLILIYRVYKKIQEARYE